jgi:hypothetical protein
VERTGQPTLTCCRGPAGPRARGLAGVHVEGLDDVFVRLSRCCTLVLGDEIIGFVTRGRGVSVHRSDCANAVSLVEGQGDRLIDARGAPLCVNLRVMMLRYGHAHDDHAGRRRRRRGP